MPLLKKDMNSKDKKRVEKAKDCKTHAMVIKTVGKNGKPCVFQGLKSRNIFSFFSMNMVPLSFQTIVNQNEPIIGFVFRAFPMIWILGAFNMVTGF